MKSKLFYSFILFLQYNSYNIFAFLHHSCNACALQDLVLQKSLVNSNLGVAHVIFFNQASCDGLFGWPMSNPDERDSVKIGVGTGHLENISRQLAENIFCAVVLDNNRSLSKKWFYNLKSGIRAQIAKPGSLPFSSRGCHRSKGSSAQSSLQCTVHHLRAGFVSPRFWCLGGVCSAKVVTLPLASTDTMLPDHQIQQHLSESNSPASQ